MVKVKYPLILVIVFIWIGFVSAISFMEAWLKFQAPGITTTLGVGIGKLVYNAMNKMECLFALVIIAYALLMKERNFSKVYVLFLIPGILLMVQTIFLLPDLNHQAQILIEGRTPPPSNFHFYYVVTEIVKVFCLSIFGINLFR